VNWPDFVFRIDYDEIEL